MGVGLGSSGPERGLGPGLGAWWLVQLIEIHWLVRIETELASSGSSWEPQGSSKELAGQPGSLAPSTRGRGTVEAVALGGALPAAWSSESWSGSWTHCANCATYPVSMAT